MPAGYFHAKANQLLHDFRQAAMAERREEMIDRFPEAGIVDGLQNSWHHSANTIYRNWLQYVASKRRHVSSFSVMVPVGSVRSSAADEIA